MAGAAKDLSFAQRQESIPACGVILLKMAEGDVRAEYLSGSELQNEDGSWRYSFLVNEADLPGGVELEDVREANIIEPYWECPEAEEVPEDECPARTIRCFEAIEDAVEIEDDDFIGVLRFDEECDVWCLHRISANALRQEQSQEIDALDYEAWPPDAEFTGPTSVYLTTMPRNFLPSDGLRISVAQIGSGTISFKVKLGTQDLLAGPMVLNGVRTLVIPNSGFDLAWRDAQIPGGTVISVEVTQVNFIPYGTNWEGARVAFLGRCV